MKIILATRNVSKSEQIGAEADGSGIEILTLDQAGIEGQAVEDGKTARENAEKKAVYALEMTTDDVYTMADDTEICINALDGMPGKDAAIWAGVGVPEKVTQDYCLRMLKGKIDQSAVFRTHICICTPDGKRHFFVGEAKGEFLKEPRCAPQKNMPYSAIFKPDDSDKVWAEMSTKEENAISH